MYVSPRDVGKKKTRPTRGDVCLTQRRGQKKQDPLGETYVSPRDVGKKTRPTKRDVCLTHWVGEEGLIDAPPPIKEGHGSSPTSPPDKKGGAYCCPSLQSPPPVKGGHRSSFHVLLGSSPHTPPHHIRRKLTRSGTKSRKTN